MKCENCKTFKKADNCISCKNEIQAICIDGLRQIEDIAHNSCYSGILLSKIKTIKDKIKGM